MFNKLLCKQDAVQDPTVLADAERQLAQFPVVREGMRAIEAYPFQRRLMFPKEVQKGDGTAKRIMEQWKNHAVIIVTSNCAYEQLGTVYGNDWRDKYVAKHPVVKTGTLTEDAMPDSAFQLWRYRPLYRQTRL
jgi:hypothetical protein